MQFGRAILFVALLEISMVSLIVAPPEKSIENEEDGNKPARDKISEKSTTFYESVDVRTDRLLKEALQMLEEVQPYQKRFWLEVFAFFLQNMLNTVKQEKIYAKKSDLLGEVLKALDEAEPIPQSFWRQVLAFFLQHLVNTVDMETKAINLMRNDFFEDLIPLNEPRKALEEILLGHLLQRFPPRVPFKSTQSDKVTITAPEPIDNRTYLEGPLMDIFRKLILETSLENNSLQQFESFLESPITSNSLQQFKPVLEYPITINSLQQFQPELEIPITYNSLQQFQPVIESPITNNSLQQFQSELEIPITYNSLEQFQPVIESPITNNSQESQTIRASTETYTSQEYRDITETSETNGPQQSPAVHLSSETNNNRQEYQQAQDTSKANTSPESKFFETNRNRQQAPKRARFVRHVLFPTTKSYEKKCYLAILSKIPETNKFQVVKLSSINQGPSSELERILPQLDNLINRKTLTKIINNRTEKIDSIDELEKVLTKIAGITVLQNSKKKLLVSVSASDMSTVATIKRNSYLLSNEKPDSTVNEDQAKSHSRPQFSKELLTSKTTPNHAVLETGPQQTVQATSKAEKTLPKKDQDIPLHKEKEFTTTPSIPNKNENPYEKDDLVRELQELPSWAARERQRELEQRIAREREREVQPAPITPHPQRQRAPITPNPERQRAPITPNPERQRAPITPNPERQRAPITPNPEHQREIESEWAHSTPTPIVNSIEPLTPVPAVKRNSFKTDYHVASTLPRPTIDLLGELIEQEKRRIEINKAKEEQEKRRIEVNMAREVLELQRLGAKREEINQALGIIRQQSPDGLKLVKIDQNTEIHKVQDSTADNENYKSNPYIWKPYASPYPPKPYINDSFEGMHIHIPPMIEHIVTDKLQGGYFSVPYNARMRTDQKNIETTLHKLQRENYLLKTRLMSYTQPNGNMHKIRGVTFSGPNRISQFLPHKTRYPTEFASSQNAQSPVGTPMLAPYPYIANSDLKNVTLQEDMGKTSSLVSKPSPPNVNSEFSDEMKRDLRNGKVILLSNSVVRSNFEPEPATDGRQKVTPSEVDETGIQPPKLVSG